MLSRKAYVVLLLGDISILYTSVWVSLALRHFAIPTVSDAVIHLASFSLLFIVWFMVYFAAGLYGRYTVLFRKQLPNIIFAAQAINIGLAAGFFFLIPFFNITPKVVLLIYLFVSTALLYFWRVYLYPHILVRRPINAVLVGTGIELNKLIKEISGDPLYPMEFKAIVHPELSTSEETERTLRLLIESGSVSTIVADMSNRSLDTLLKFIYDITFIERSAVFIDVRKLYQEIFERVPLSLVNDRWLLRYVSLEQHTVYTIGKRTIDIIGAVLLGTLSLVLYPFIIIAIKLESRGPIFYTTNRIGMGGRAFKFSKFRSMTGGDEGQQVLKTMHSVTRVGKVLRRSRLDELPQLWSVLKGEMSFIGPRPELPALVIEYRQKIPHYNLRHLVKPGLSGWAQIRHDNHSHGEINIATTTDKLSYDLYYIKERSLWLDFYTAMLTAKTLIKKGS